MDFEKTRVLVLSGGPGSEREVSLESGRNVAAALQEVGDIVVCSDVDPERLDTLPFDQADVVFPALHGAFGEGGELQKYLEGRGVRFTGSSSTASRTAMDKWQTLQIACEKSIPTPETLFLEASAAADLNGRIERILGRIPPPCVVKPNDEGSSVGITIAQTVDQAASAIRELSSEQCDVLVEQYLPGRELTVGILGKRALPVLEIIPANSFYDYHAKYLSDSTRYSFEIDLPETTLRIIQENALVIFEALGCRDFGRVDFMTDADGQPYLLEVNTIPGLTSHSLFPKAATAAGLKMPELCHQIVRQALDRPI